ncbi:MAG TPA: GTP pyrophosphokinase [Patescibacteria group bacterium]|nr:GTP pyrophosphokinase [Patescibacteria group bacterium]
MIEVALQIAVKAHERQKDLGGEAYILHPLRVMAKMRSVDEKIVAILHDVVKNQTVDLIVYGFSAAALKALDALTRRKNEKYETYIYRLAENRIARKVKIADLEDNMNVARLFMLTTQDLERLRKYQTAWVYLVACG